MRRAVMSLLGRSMKMNTYYRRVTLYHTIRWYHVAFQLHIAWTPSSCSFILLVSDSLFGLHDPGFQLVEVLHFLLLHR